MFLLGLLSNLAGPEGLIILGVVVLLFGAKRLPEIGRSLGETVRQFSKTREENEAPADDKNLPPKV